MNRSPVSEAGELKPCPFCGEHLQLSDGETVRWWRHPASNCPGMVLQGIEEHPDRDAKAIAAWNRRSLDNADVVRWHAGIETAPVACTLLATYFDADVGEWIVQIFAADKPTAPFTHWQFITSPCGPWALSRPIQNGEVGVKGLEWEAAGNSDWVADSVIGQYVLNRDELSAGGCFNLWMPDTGDDDFGIFTSASEAKAAAQADFDQRIRSVLTPPAVTAGEAEPVDPSATAWMREGKGRPIDVTLWHETADVWAEDGYTITPIYATPPLPQIDEGMVDAAIDAFIEAVNNPLMVACDRCGGKGHHHGFGEDGHDPDWCSECGGNQYNIVPGEEARAMRAALKAALTHWQAKRVSP